MDLSRMKRVSSNVDDRRPDPTMSLGPVDPRYKNSYESTSFGNPALRERWRRAEAINVQMARQAMRKKPGPLGRIEDIE